MQGLKANTIDEVLALPDEEIDIATAGLLLSKQWDNTVDIEKYRRQIDEMALSLEPMVAKEQSPYAIVRAINNYLFVELKYDVPEAAKFESPSRNIAMMDEKLFFLHSVLETKKGVCTGLSMLYLSLAERLHLPIYSVAVPGHLFVRYDDNKIRINIETTDKGTSHSNSYYARHFQVSHRKLYLVNLNKKQTIGYLLSNLGLAYRNQGKIDEAMAEWKKTISIVPDYPDAHSNLGLVYLKQGNLEKAIVEYKKVISIIPRYAEAHVNLGIAYGGQGKLEEEIAALKTAIKINPNLAEAHYNLGLVYRKQSKIEKAIVEYKTAIRINPNYLQAHVNLGLIYQKQGKLDEAISEYKTAISITPNDAEAHYNLGVVYNKQGKLDEAISEYKTAIRIEPNLSEAHVNLGLIYQNQGKVNEGDCDVQSCPQH